MSFLVISGKPKPEELETAWDRLYDTYFKKKDDRKAKLILKTKAKIAMLSYKIIIAKNTILFISSSYLTDAQRNLTIKNLKKILKINIDPKKDFTYEVHRVLTTQIAAWETNLKMEKHNLEELQKGKVRTFEFMADAINDSKTYKAIDRNTTLLEFLESENREIEKGRERKKQQDKGKNRRR